MQPRQEVGTALPTAPQAGQLHGRLHLAQAGGNAGASFPTNQKRRIICQKMYREASVPEASLTLLLVLLHSYSSTSLTLFFFFY